MPPLQSSPQLNRVSQFYGGITMDKRDTSPGVHLNMEEVDIFAEKNSVRPTTIFSADETITRRVTGYTLDKDDNLFAIGRNAAGTPKAQVWKKTTASVATPGAWASFITSAQNSNAQSPIEWHEYKIDISSITVASTTATVAILASAINPSGTHGLAAGDTVTIEGAITAGLNGTFTIDTVPATTSFTYTVASRTTESISDAQVRVGYLYYVTATRTLVRLGPTPSVATEYTTDLTGVNMTLPALGNYNDRIPMLRDFGSLYIGNGQYISEIDNNGIFSPQSFQLPDGWEVVSMATAGENMAVLARSVNTGMNHSMIFYWDLTSAEQPLDRIRLSMGGPQIVFNWHEAIWAICAQNGNLIAYVVSDRQAIPKLFLDNISEETDTQAIIPDATKFTFEDCIYFALWKTDKTGIYAIGSLGYGFSPALIMAKRFAPSTVSDYDNHIPYAVFAAGPNMYASYSDNGTPTLRRLEANNSPTYSSDAVIETVYINAQSPEMLKTWPGIVVISHPMGASCSITVSGRTDDASSYKASTEKELTPEDDQLADGATADTYWVREWVSLRGRSLQSKIKFKSNGSTSRPTLLEIAPISVEESLYG